tara:strand:+ start:12734 stop:13669 length:936 start_codon:yes stop_codon:yes gene_type:complete
MKYNYLLGKIENASFEEAPFKHLHIMDFFSEDHFNEIITNNQIKRPTANNTRDLINDLINAGYKIQTFAGSIVSVDDYIAFLEDKNKFNKNLLVGQGVKILSGYGMTMRLNEYQSEFLEELYEFLNGNEFTSCLRDKFNISNSTRVETAYQKNLTGYNLNPHPDMRNKALTYMANIYTQQDSHLENFHTHFLDFKDEYKYIKKFWKENQNVETCWVPWDWCSTVKKTSQNNSISIFKPSFDSLHAVDIDYDHLKQQRNQIYGNLWYENVPEVFDSNHTKLDLLSNHTELYIKESPLRKVAKNLLKKTGLIN